MTPVTPSKSRFCSHPLRATGGGGESAPLGGVLSVPGDKSISHRALILAAMAPEKSRIFGLLEGADVLHTAACLRALGASIERDWPLEEGGYVVQGGAWQSPRRALYCGNAGTGVRLLIGAVAGRGLEAGFDGDISLRGRPMGRVLGPLQSMGLVAKARDGHLPLHLKPSRLEPFDGVLAYPSAQVKSAILLAALGAQGETRLREPVLTRDHTERMLAGFGVALDFIPLEGGGREIRLRGPQTLKPCDVYIPRDPSSAAFGVVACLLVPGSELRLPGILQNEGRTGLFGVLRQMGADVQFEKEQLNGGERRADMVVRASDLRAVHVSADQIPAMVDEIPILAVAASFAKGTSRFEGLAELRIKESDRLAAIEQMLSANGVTVRVGEDWLEIDGAESVRGGGLVETRHDHRIAMSGLVLGMATQNPVTIDDGAMIATSYPDFVVSMNAVGARIKVVSD